MHIDSVTTGRFRLLYPDFAVRVIRTMNDIDRTFHLQMKCTEGLRTFERQAALYAQGRTTPGKKVTGAQAGQTWHNYGLAADLCFQGDDPYLNKHKDRDHIWEAFGRSGESHGLVWGGRWKVLVDKPHLELKYGLTIDEVKALYDHGKMEGVWTKLDQIRGVPIGQDWMGPQSRSQLLDLGLIDS